MNEVLVISTGGTIAMNGGVVANGSLDSQGEKLVEFSNLPSPFFDSDFAYRLSSFIIGESKNYKSFVITHGTDTMEESAYYLDLVLDPDITVVFTGAIHMQNHTSYDGVANLHNAILAAKSLDGGVYIVFDSDILPARYATKINANSARSFAAPASGRVGEIVMDRVIKFYDLPKRKTVLTPATKGKIALIRSHYDIDAELIKPLFEMSDGVVLEGFGGGRIPHSIVDLVKHYAEKKPVVIASSVIEYATGDGYRYKGGYAWAKEEARSIIYSQTDGKKSAIALNLATKNSVNVAKFFNEEI